MTVEAATYIAQLNPNNPAGTDFVEEGDDHITLIKQVLQNQFPLLGNNVVSPTAAELNNVVGSTGNIQEQLNVITVSYGYMLSSESSHFINLTNSYSKFTQANAANFSDAGVSVSPSTGQINILKANPDFVRLNLVLSLKLNSPPTVGDGYVIRGLLVRESNNTQLPGSLTLARNPTSVNDQTLLVIQAIDPNPAASGEKYHLELNTSYIATVFARVQSLSFGLEVVGGA